MYIDNLSVFKILYYFFSFLFHWLTVHFSFYEKEALQVGMREVEGSHLKMRGWRGGGDKHYLRTTIERQRPVENYLTSSKEKAMALILKCNASKIIKLFLNVRV